ncbi:hypothetical protein LOTGIDRAFT_171410 [Lottia gigantea]|uniref:Uncharacterized protein n=1 Tax=Lottia gigantea TaxID=225164 RepID=V4B0D4_LOTGI|nr:hypothetical protein LOTGIDRAFT_171410 [Lottia gigantea]ESP03473.1 hypothetical protein LOTGIDRAFT_171410 [Lottia gigantea]
MIVAHAPKTFFGSGDIQKPLSSLPGFSWAKYPGEKHLPGHNYTGPGTRQNFSLYKKFNAQNILQFINGTKNVEFKEFEINDENSTPRHLYEIKTSGKYIDKLRMLIIPDKEEDEFTLSNFDMLLETETPPSTSIIRNPEPQKEGI